MPFKGQLLASVMQAESMSHIVAISTQLKAYHSVIIKTTHNVTGIIALALSIAIILITYYYHTAGVVVE